MEHSSQAVAKLDGPSTCQPDGCPAGSLCLVTPVPDCDLGHVTTDPAKLQFLHL
jgi:hypothetical protein